MLLGIMVNNICAQPLKATSTKIKHSQNTCKAIFRNSLYNILHLSAVNSTHPKRWYLTSRTLKRSLKYSSVFAT